MKYLIRATFVVTVLLAGIWYIPALIWGYQITEAMVQEQDGEDNRLNQLANDGPAPVRWFRNRKELRETFSLDELTPRRYVTYTVDLPFQSLLSVGEAMPEPVYQKLYATARAPRMIGALCSEMLGVIAARCDVAQTSASPRSDGRVQLSGRLVHVPIYDIGDPNTVDNGHLLTVRAQLFGPGDLADTNAGRRAAFQKAIEICEELRGLYGNCVISNLALKPRAYDGLDSLSVTGRFTLLVDKSSDSEDTVQAAVKEIEGRLLN